MATQKDIERRLTEFAEGALFIRPCQLAKAMNQTKTQNVKRYTLGAFKPTGSQMYFIPDVAENIFRAGDWG